MGSYVATRMQGDKSAEQALQRQRALLYEYILEFRKMKKHVTEIRERTQLLSSVEKDIRFVIKEYLVNQLVM